MSPIETFTAIAQRYAVGVSLLPNGKKTEEYKFLKKIGSTGQLVAISNMVVDVLSPTCSASNKVQCLLQDCCWVKNSGKKDEPGRHSVQKSELKTY